ncbi:hypothetical protein F5B22DRAFT_515826 [Xylaria bambusicola]|uniref:uncharacterized protein n=1 Tax=Xylaria bambusicola TaxID=326684 RepID=UPI002007A3AF|nr:uncharacterized protein F5B22DRAFT_515826 [Xylaria bambusicola]KAI0505623.1 hypothetical protein F5B22DRAFT_515826 [Xylaria bambusicola]
MSSSLILLTQAFAALAATTRTCYHITGEPARHSPGRPKYMPCDPDAEVSNCCSEIDLCMGNGICLGFNAYNGYTFQACTHPDWPEACSHGFKWPNTIPSGFYALVWQCRYGYNSPYCVGENASCCEDEDGWVYLPRFSNIHFAGNSDYVIRASGGNGIIEGSDVSDRIALGVGISIPIVAILVAIGQWWFPGARLWIWKKRKGPEKLKKGDDDDDDDDDKSWPSEDAKRFWFWKKRKRKDREKRKRDDDGSRLLEEGGITLSSEGSSGLEMSTAGDIGERQLWYKDDPQAPGSEQSSSTKIIR